ncbi:MAG TPA: hypothetical protein PKA31_00495 [Candidatus Moranbacteria bacterium]|nr:hypothetical protein [Candidatus Moranbacteria bacterium]
MPATQSKAEPMVWLLVSTCGERQVILVPERRKDPVGIPLIGKRKTDPGHKILSR